MGNNIVKILVVAGLAVLQSACSGGNSTKLLEDIDIVPLRHTGTGGTFIYFNLNGQQAFEGEFMRAGLFSNGLAKVGKREDKTYSTVFIDKQGKTVFDVSGYEEVTGFWNNMAWAKKEDGSVVALDTKGKEVFVLEGTPMSMFNDGKALVKIESDKYGIVNTSGKITSIETEFEVKKVPVIYADRLLVYDNARGLGVIDLKGNVIVEPGFYGHIEAYDMNGCAVVQKSDLRGSAQSLIDKNGKELIDFEYNYRSLKCDGDWYQFAQSVGNKVVYGWCDKHGKVKCTLSTQQLREEIGRTSLWGFLGSDYAFWGSYKIDRKGQLVQLPAVAHTPLLGGKSIVAGDRPRCTLFSKDGQCLIGNEFYMEGDMKNLQEEETAKGYPYISTYWVMGDY